jgi:hypothetical protein
MDHSTSTTPFLEGDRGRNARDATPVRVREVPPRIDIDSIPLELREGPYWGVWKLETVEDRPKRTKVPYQVAPPYRNGRRPKASTTNLAHWTAFDRTYQFYLDEHFDGIGRVFSKDDPFLGIDLDNCLDHEGRVRPWAEPYFELFRTYSEVSPSGTGVKFWGRGKLPGPEGLRREQIGPDGDGAIELYDWGRFFTVTGNVYDDPQTVEFIGDRAAAVYLEIKPKKPQLRDRPPREVVPLDLDDSEIIAKATAAKNGSKFDSLYRLGSIAGYGSQSRADFALLGMLAFWCGPDEPRIERLFSSSALGQRMKWTDRPDYRERSIRNMLEGKTEFYDPSRRGPPRKRGGSSPAEPPANSDDGSAPRPKRLDIEINTERHIVLEEAIKALANDPNIYRRGAALVSVVQETADELRLGGKTTMKGIAGSPKIIDLSDAVIGCRLTENAQFYQWKKDKNGEFIDVDAHPPDWLIKAVATRKYWPGIRPLNAVVECPFPRPDGSIVETPGYDVETATVFLPTFDFPKLPDRPTRADARSAWGRLRWYVREFPFPSEDDCVVFLAGLLNVIGRPAVIGPTPGIAINGNKAATGKGLLVDAMTMPGIGRSAPTSSYPDDHQEAVKVKVAIVLSGKPVVSFDNLGEGSMYGGSAIDSALTALTIDDRILGMSRNTGEIPVRTAWFLNGNNITPTKDAWRRWLVCNLTTDLEHPERRGDIEDKDLRALILKNRAEIVRDALVILKSHALDGRPTGGWPPMGSFEEWDRVIRSAVWFATERDCLATQRQTADDAPDRLAKIAVLEGLRELPDAKAGQSGVTSGEAIGLVEKNPLMFNTLRGVLLERGRGGKLANSGTLGFILRGLKNTPIGGMKLKDTGFKRNSAVCWIVEGDPSRDTKDAKDGSGHPVASSTVDHDVTTCGDNGKAPENGRESSLASFVSSPSVSPAERLRADAARLGVRLKRDGEKVAIAGQSKACTLKELTALREGLAEFPAEVLALIEAPPR